MEQRVTLADVIENPEWVNAPYEMLWVTKQGILEDSWPHRFKTPWPEDIKNSLQLNKWVLENSIPRYIPKP